MNRKNILTAIVLLLAATTVSAQVSFGSAAAGPNTEWTDVATYTTSISADANPAQQVSVDRAKTCRVLDVDNAGRIDSVSVEYSVSSEPSVIGRRYRVTPQGVSYENGGTPPPAEAEFVRRDNAGFNQFRALDRIFGGKSFTMNQSFSPNRNDAEELLNVAAGMRLRAITLTLRSVTNGVARFDISMGLESDPKEKKNGALAAGRMSINLNGTLDITTATSRPVLFDVAGNINAVINNKHDGAVARSATGSTSIRIEYGF